MKSGCYSPVNASLRQALQQVHKRIDAQRPATDSFPDPSLTLFLACVFNRYSSSSITASQECQRSSITDTALPSDAASWHREVEHAFKKLGNRPKKASGSKVKYRDWPHLRII